MSSTEHSIKNILCKNNDDDRRIIAFYAPLKSPLHPTPSGDRKIAQLFIKALDKANFKVELASQLRSFDKKGNIQRQQKMILLARKEANRILKRWHNHNINPCAWFSYHLYYKAPDLIGPIICQALNIPYIVAEASWAIKRAQGPWATYHSQVDVALQKADKVICINPIDKIALDLYFQTKKNNYHLIPLISTLKPYIDDIPAVNHNSRTKIAEKFGLDPTVPWLITIAMMRSGDKFHSYKILQDTINRLETPHQLLIIGDGEKSTEISLLFRKNSSTFFAGQLANDQVLTLLPYFKLLIWPAINEALGMIFLEAQQAGVPVIAGDQGGVSSVVKDQYSGLIIPVTTDEGLAIKMSEAINNLLNNHHQLQCFKKNAEQYIQQSHSLTIAAVQLKSIVEDANQRFRSTSC